MKIKYLKSVKIYQVVAALEHYAPLPLQEGYDNAGLQVGLTEAVEVSGALLCLDVTEAVVDEAIRKGCNLIVSHHPLIFRKLARISDENYVQRTVRRLSRTILPSYPCIRIWMRRRVVSTSK